MISDKSLAHRREATVLRGIQPLGHRVLVETNSNEFGAAADRLLRSLSITVDPPQQPEAVFTVWVSDDPTTRHRFYRNGKLFRKTDQFWKLVRLLEWQLDIFLWRHERRHMLMHAGAVAIGDAGVLIPGSSHAGKSSLTLSLLLRGGRYFSDEVGVVTTDSGELLAFPKPVSSRVPQMFPQVSSWFGPTEQDLAKRTDGWKPVWFTHADDVRQGSVAGPVRVSHVIFPEAGEGSEPKLEQIDGREVMGRLIRHNANFEIVGAFAFHGLARIVREARCYRLMRNGLDSTADLVLDMISADGFATP